MKRLLTIALAFVSIGIVGMASDAKATDVTTNNIAVEANASAQWQRDRYGRRIYNRRRTTTRSRVIRLGRRLYRETLLVTYLPNGRVVDTRVIRRVRIR